MTHDVVAAIPPPSFGLIVVGDEILSGRRADKHMAKVIELLAARGLILAWAEYVGDDPVRITATLRRVFASSDVVFSTGGIGATPDDHTRQCAAQALDRPLELHPQARVLIEARMREMAEQQGTPYDPQHPDSLMRLKMGVFPSGAGVIANPYNRIPGFHCDGPGGGRIHFVPGFPVMAWPMIEAVLDQDYARWHGQQTWQERSVILIGALEAPLTPVMERVQAAHPAVKVFSLPSVDHPQYGRHIDLGVKGPPADVVLAYADLRAWLLPFQLQYGPEVVRP